MTSTKQDTFDRKTYHLRHLVVFRDHTDILHTLEREPLSFSTALSLENSKSNQSKQNVPNLLIITMVRINSVYTGPVRNWNGTVPYGGITFLSGLIWYQLVNPIRRRDPPGPV